MPTTVKVLAAVCFLAAHAASAQTSAGGHFSTAANEYPDQTRSGAGAFVSYTPGLIGLDVSTTYFISGGIGGNAWQMVAGPRLGVTRDRLGIYGRVRPGFIRFSERVFKPDVVCIAIFPPPDACLADRTNLALDLGVTVEAFPSARSVVRIDAGDAMTRFDGRQGTVWTHGLQVVIGGGMRF